MSVFELADFEIIIFSEAVQYMFSGYANFVVLSVFKSDNIVRNELPSDDFVHIYTVGLF